MRMNLNIRQKILFGILTSVTLIFIISIGYVVYQLQTSLKRDALENANLVATNKANEIQLFFERNMVIARTLAQGLAANKQLDSTVWQNFYPHIYRNVIQNYPHINTLWDSWEYYDYVPGYNKEFGRYCITLYREQGEIKNKIDRRSLTGDPLRYGGFKKGNQEGIWEPYLDQVLKGNERFLMTTIAAPIQRNGRFIGIVGIDITLSDLQKQIEKIRPVKGSYAYLVSMGGIIAAHPDTSYIFKNFEEKFPNDEKQHNLKNIIAKGQEYTYTRIDNSGNEHIVFMKPIKVGNSYSVWSLAYSMPMKEITDQINKSFLIALAVALTGLFLLVLIIIYLANNITHPIVKITQVLHRLGKGEISKDLMLNIDSGDEIEQMAIALNQFLTGLNEKSTFAQNIGQGNYDTQLTLLSEKDALGISLVEMQKNLIKARKEEEKRIVEEKKRIWANEGLALFGEILHRNSSNQQILVDELIRHFVKYLGANQGAIYLLNDNDSEKYLELVSAYAWDRKKLIEKKIYIGEGLVGACFHENQTTYMTKVPNDYIKITSGLGDATPTALVLVPLKHESGTQGVLELASFNPFEDYQIEFLERVCQNVANTLSVVKINERTKYLLEKSNEQTKQMQTQEEEMRQNMEELLATQEEMARKEREMAVRMEAIGGLAMFMEYDFNGMILSVNQKTCQVTGYTKEELINRHHSILFDNKEFSKSETYNKFWSIMRSGKSYSGIFKRKTKDGNFRLIKGFIHPIFDEDGLPSKIFEIGVEIDNLIQPKID